MRVISLLCSYALVLLPSMASAGIASVNFVNNYIQSNFNYTPAAASGIASSGYLMRMIDAINSQRGCISSDFASTAQSSKVIGTNWLTDTLSKNIINCGQYYQNSGLIMNLDFSIPLSIDNGTVRDLAGTNSTTAFAAPTFTDKSVILNTAGAYMRTTSAIDLTPYEYITIEVRFRLLNTAAQTIIFESSNNWNSQTGGFGICANTNSSPYSADMLHGNHNGTATFNMPNVAQTDLAQHTVAWTLSSNSIANNHKVFYDGALRGTFSGSRGFRNDYIWFGQRGDSISSTTVPNIEYYSIRIYNRTLTDAEICANAQKDYNRFGGTAPNCV